MAIFPVLHRDTLVQILETFILLASKVYRSEHPAIDSCSTFIYFYLSSPKKKAEAK